MKCYDMEVLDAEMSFFFFSQETTLGHMQTLGKVTIWLMIQLQNGGSLNLPYIEAFKLLKFSDWNVKNRQNVILDNVDYLCKGIKDEVLRGNILEVVLSVTIKDANTVAICACVAELMI